MLYVGFHKGAINDGYICSSKYMLEQYNERPLDFNRTIIARGSKVDMHALEVAILKSVNAAQNTSFYNMHNGFGDYTLIYHTEESKRKISIGNKGNIRLDLSERNKRGHSKE